MPRPAPVPAACAALFETSYVDYADADVTGTLDAAPAELVHRIHLVASPEPGLVTVCESSEGWRFLPGGRLEPGESMGAAVERELLEEAGAEVRGPVREFFAQVAHSRRAAPYRPHVPHPHVWWVFAAADVVVVGPPTSPEDAEQVVAVHHLPAADAAAWLEVHDPDHAAVVRLARHLGLV